MELKPAEIKKWPVVPFGTLYGSPSRNGIYKTEGFHGSGCRIVNMGEMFGLDFISDQDMSRVALTERELATSGLEGGDLLFGRRSVVESGAGRCSLVVKPSEPLTFESSIIRVRLKQDVAIPLFFYYFFRSPSGRLLISQIISGTNVKGIRGSELKRLPVPIPPLREQNEIAESLSDIDELIGALDKLIAKKRDLKQAAMQQLLTGKRRLPGFSRKWEVERLGEVIDFANGKPHEGHIDPIGRYSLITLDSIGIDGKLKVEHRPIGILDGSLMKGDIVIILSDLAYGNLLGLCDLIPENNRYVLNQRVGRLRVKSGGGVNPQFLRFQINQHQEHFKKRGQGTSQRHIYRRDIDQLEIPLPKLDEQIAIATVLSDIDAELAAVERRREKTRAIKQGMMQELLTGKTRLT